MVHGDTAGRRSWALLLVMLQGAAWLAERWLGRLMIGLSYTDTRSLMLGGCNFILRRLSSIWQADGLMHVANTPALHAHDSCTSIKLHCIQQHSSATRSYDHVRLATCANRSQSGCSRVQRTQPRQVNQSTVTTWIRRSTPAEDTGAACGDLHFSLTVGI